MPKGIDARIQAQVRILLARRWIDLRTVTIGTTNGVVYVGGALRAAGGPAADAVASPATREAWRERIRREIAALPGVRDVVFQLQDSSSTGGTCPPKVA